MLQQTELFYLIIIEFITVIVKVKGRKLLSKIKNWNQDGVKIFIFGVKKSITVVFSTTAYCKKESLRW